MSASEPLSPRSQWLLGETYMLRLGIRSTVAFQWDWKALASLGVAKHTGFEYSRLGFASLSITCQLCDCWQIGQASDSSPFTD